MAVSAQASAPRLTEGLCFVGGWVGGDARVLPSVEATKGSRLAPHGSQSKISLGLWFLARAPNCISCWLSRQCLCRCLCRCLWIPSGEEGLLCLLNTHRHKIPCPKEAVEAEEAVLKALREVV